MNEMVLSGIEGSKNNWQVNVSGALVSSSARATIVFFQFVD